MRWINDLLWTQWSLAWLLPECFLIPACFFLEPSLPQSKGQILPFFQFTGGGSVSEETRRHYNLKDHPFISKNIRLSHRKKLSLEPLNVSVEPPNTLWLVPPPCGGYLVLSQVPKGSHFVMMPTTCSQNFGSAHKFHHVENPWVLTVTALIAVTTALYSY